MTLLATKSTVQKERRRVLCFFIDERERKKERIVLKIPVNPPFGRQTSQFSTRTFFSNNHPTFNLADSCEA